MTKNKSNMESAMQGVTNHIFRQIGAHAKPLSTPDNPSEDPELEQFARIKTTTDVDSDFGKFWEEIYKHTDKAPLLGNMNRAESNEQFNKVSTYLKLIRAVLDCFLHDKKSAIGAKNRLEVTKALLVDMCKSDIVSPAINEDQTINTTQLAQLLRQSMHYYVDNAKALGFKPEIAKQNIEELVKDFEHFAEKVKQIQSE